MRDPNNLIDEQLDYYRARAAEYDDWFLRRGQFDRGPRDNARWFAELRTLEAALNDASPIGDVLELACGTGWWTKLLLTGAKRLVAVDAAPEMLQLNRERVQDSRVEYVLANLFDWRPEDQFDFVFFGGWLSHVPRDRFEAFWSTVASALKPEGCVFFADTKRVPSASAPSDSGNAQIRRLKDGREFRIVKIYYEPQELAARLTHLGWRGHVRATETFFIFGTADRMN